MFSKNFLAAATIASATLGSTFSASALETLIFDGYLIWEQNDQIHNRPIPNPVNATLVRHPEKNDYAYSETASACSKDLKEIKGLFIFFAADGISPTIKSLKKAFSYEKDTFIKIMGDLTYNQIVQDEIGLDYVTDGYIFKDQEAIDGIRGIFITQPTTKECTKNVSSRQAVPANGYTLF